MGKSQTPASAKKSQASPGKNSTMIKRLQSCRACKGCKRENCGKCANCQDMVQFGGTGTRKAKCLNRVCEDMQTTYVYKSKTAQTSPKPKSPVPTSTSKAKMGTPKKVGSRTASDIAKVVQVIKKVRSDSAKTPLVDQKSKSMTGVVVNRAALVEKSPKRAETGLRTPQQSPKGKAQGILHAQTSTNIKSENKPSSNKTKTDIKKLPQESPKNRSESQAVRNSPRVRPMVPSGSENTPKVRRVSDKEASSNFSAKKFYSKPTDLTAEATSESADDVKGSKLTKDENLTPKDSKSVSSESATAVSSQKDIDLPTVELDSMSKAELKEFIPKLLKLVTGKEEVFYSRRSAKPEWWPDDVVWAKSKSAWLSEKYWTDNLKSVVKNCYRHVGKEDLLQSYVADSQDPEARSSESFGLEDIHSEDSVKTGSYPSSPVKIRMFPQGLFLPFSAEIYICYFCEKEFLSKEKMRSHQKDCTERPPDLKQMYSKVSTLSDTNISSQPPSMSPKKSVNQIWPKQSHDKFAGILGLVQKLTAAKLREQRPSLEEIDCEILDDIEPISPVTPKTPKSLISQLSRDDSNHVSRKRLSYSISMDSHKEALKVETESESDSEAETREDNKPVHEMNLLDIPISSLLGQRVKKYVHVDSPLGIVEDTGTFCRTPVKNTFLEKLRKKPLAFPVLYRPRRIANMHKQNHIYRFKRSEVKEYMCRLNTGLNPASIEKLRYVKKFSIRVPRLSRKRLLDWIPREVLDKQLRGVFKGLKYNPYSELDGTICEFPSGPTLLAKNIDKMLGLKKRSSQESSDMTMKNSLSVSNFISEEMEAEISKQKLTLYRSLLYEMSVLKPAVVMEDIGGHVMSAKCDNPGKSQFGRITTTAVDGDTVRAEEKEVKPKSVFRDMLRKSREERLMAEAEERERKEDYQTLKAILKAPRAQEHVKVATKRAEKNTPLSLDFCGGKNEKKSPIDDCVSVLSGSSEGESLHSTCCQGCCDKRHHLAKQSNADMKYESQGQGNLTPFVQPLHVDVDLGTSKIDEYGIPSPISISSESPFPPTPSKSNSSSLNHSSQGSVKDVDSVETSPILRRETRSTRSSGLSSPVKGDACGSDPSVFSLTSSRSHDKINQCVSDLLMKNSLRKIQSEGIRTRSCSGTPSDSPVKRSSRSGCSAPTSPSKAQKPIKLPLDMKQISDKLESSDSARFSKFKIKSKLRSGSIASELGVTKESECFNRSPQSSASSSMVNKQTSDSCSSGKAVSDKNMEGGEKRKLESRFTRSKRRSSVLLEGTQPTKLRKVYSDMAVNSR